MNFGQLAILLEVSALRQLHAADQRSNPSQQVDLAATLWSLPTHCEGNGCGRASKFGGFVPGAGPEPEDKNVQFISVKNQRINVNRAFPGLSPPRRFDSFPPRGGRVTWNKNVMVVP